MLIRHCYPWWHLSNLSNWKHRYKPKECPESHKSIMSQWTEDSYPSAIFSSIAGNPDEDMPSVSSFNTQGSSAVTSADILTTLFGTQLTWEYSSILSTRPMLSLVALLVWNDLNCCLLQCYSCMIVPSLGSHEAPSIDPRRRPHKHGIPLWEADRCVGGEV